MKLFFVCLTVMSLFLACSRKRSDSDAPAVEIPLVADDNVEGSIRPLRSLAEINKILQGRLIADSSFNILDALLDEKSDWISAAFGTSIHAEVGALMGMYQGSGSRVATDTMSYSPVHVLLWGLTFESFSQRVAAICSGQPSSYSFHPGTQAVMAKVCKSAPDALKEDLRELWNALLRTDGLNEEFEAWYADESSTALALSESERLAFAMKSMLFSAEFMMGR